MVAIFNFSKTLKKSLAHLHIRFKVFVPTNFFLSWPLAAALNFGSIFEKSLAHLLVARDVMLK